MNAHVPPPGNVVRFPLRLPVVPSAPSALDALLSAGTIDARQHAAGLAYARLRRRYKRSGGPMRSWRDRSGLSDDV